MIGVILLSILAFSCAVKFDNNAVIPSVAERAQPGVPGGKEVVSLTEREYPELLKLSTEAIEQLDALSTDSNKVHFLIRIKEAARAVVAGWMHEITFYLGECTDGTYTVRIRQNKIFVTLVNLLSLYSFQEQEPVLQSSYSVRSIDAIV